MTKKTHQEEPISDKPSLLEFEFISHDFHGEDKFDSSEVSKEDYEKVITGKGLNEKEAAENAIEELLIEENEKVDVSLLHEKVETLDEVYYEPPMGSFSEDEDTGDYIEEPSEEKWYFLSIRYNLPK
jgi:hypothetical protein